MKPTVRRLLVAMFVLVLGAVPAIALAQSPFSDYKDAAKAQYGPTTTSTTPTTAATTPTTPTTPTTTVGSTVGSETQTPTEQVPPSTETTPNGEQPPNNGNNPGGNNESKGASPRNAPGAAGGAGNLLAGLGCNTYAIIGLSPLLQPAVPDVVAALGRAAYISDVTEPLDPAKLKALTDGTQWEGASTDLTKLRAFAKALGAAVPDVLPLAKKAFPELADFPTNYPKTWTLQDFSPIAGIVLTHVQVPLKGDANKQRNAFIRAFIRGLQTVKVPDVEGGKVDLPLAGVEQKVTKKSEIPFFKKLGVSSVDDVDLAKGKLSLARIMFGAVGHFGVKKTADDGKLAQPSGKPAPLLCRPNNKYVAGKLLRGTTGGIPGGGSTIGILLVLGLVATASMLAIVERRTRRLRRKTL